MTTLREVAQQALAVMQTNAYAVANEAPHQDVMAYYEAIAALAEALTEEALQRLTDANQEIEAALEQPEQEPVAWCDIEEDGTIHGLRYWSEPGRREHALYTHPPRREWRGLTDQEMHGLYRRAGLETYYPRDGVVQYEYERRLDEYARAIEAALRSKNYD
jgi:hypothetical protein